MASTGYAEVLCERLGDDGYAALEEMMQVSQQNLLTVDRFEHRLREELGKVRADVRADMSELRGELRGEMQQLRADIRIDIAERSSELMKWAMLFWVGQAAAVVGIIAVLR